jgi:hypothetical protein
MARHSVRAAAFVGREKAQDFDANFTYGREFKSTVGNKRNQD